MSEALEKVFGVPAGVGQLGVLDVVVQGLEPTGFRVIEIVLAGHDHVAVQFAAGIELDGAFVAVLIFREDLEDDLDAGQLLEVGDLGLDERRERVLVHQESDLGSLELLPVYLS